MSDFDESHTLNYLRKKIKKKGATRVKTAQDNAFSLLEQDDYVLLDDYDHNLGKVVEIWDMEHGGTEMIVELENFAFEEVDPFSVTRAAPNDV